MAYLAELADIFGFISLEQFFPGNGWFHVGNVVKKASHRAFGCGMTFLFAIVTQSRGLVWALSRRVAFLLADEALLRRGNVVIRLCGAIIDVVSFGLAEDASPKVGTDDTFLGTFTFAMSLRHVRFFSAIGNPE